jgi:hypothetical protein
MAELMNWPPSRGPNPGQHMVSYKQGKITREDVRIPRSPMSAAEAEMIEAAGGVVEEENAEIPAPEEPAERAPVVGTWYVWFQIEDVASLNLDQAINLLRGRTDDEKERHCSDDWSFSPVEKFGILETMITYPLNTAVHLVIEPLTITRTWGKSRPAKVTHEMRLGYFLWVVAQEYVRIYEEAEKYGIWGHAMTDLGFEGVIVHEDGTVDVMIGS